MQLKNLIIVLLQYPDIEILKNYYIINGLYRLLYSFNYSYLKHLYLFIIFDLKLCLKVNYLPWMPIDSYWLYNQLTPPRNGILKLPGAPKILLIMESD